MILLFLIDTILLWFHISQCGTREAATIYGESSAYKASGSEVSEELRNEMFAIAEVHQSNKTAYGANSSQAKRYLNDTPEERSKQPFRRTATAAVIHGLSGSSKYSNGATHWDGAEQATAFPSGFKGSSKGGFEAHRNTWGWSISTKHYNKWKANIGSGFNAPQVHKATVGINKGKIRATSTAVHGETIFWRVK